MASKSAGASRLFIGPAGWSYADWEGPVYSAGTGLDRLRFIARFFRCIELNSSFYRIPSAKAVQSWTERLPSGGEFLLNVKVLGRFTHDRDLDAASLEDFIDRFAPLSEAGQLGLFLLQFPWSFRKDEASLSYLERLAGFFEEGAAAVELRHASWKGEETLELLSRRGLVLCNIDQPVIGGSIPPSALLTRPDTGYIRLHGRNYRDWFRKGAGRDARYDYLYSKDEIEEWKVRAANMLASVDRLFIITNNHFRGQALVNAFQLEAALTGERPKVPGSLKRSYGVLSDFPEAEEFEDGLF